MLRLHFLAVLAGTLVDPFTAVALAGFAPSGVRIIQTASFWTASPLRSLIFLSLISA